MIVPMRKFYLIVLDKDRKSAPVHLRKLGIAHVEELQGSGETFQALEKKRAEAETACLLLANYAEKKQKTASKSAEGPQKAGQNADAAAIVDEITRLKHELDALNENAAQLAREIERVSSWGEISAGQIADISEKAQISIRFFESFGKDVHLPEGLHYIRLASPRGRIRIAILSERGEKLQDLPPSFQEFIPPSEPLSLMRTEHEAIIQQIRGIESQLRAKTDSLPLIKSWLSELESELALERLRSGMPAHDQFAYLKGYLPARDAEKLRKLAAQKGWAVAFEDPSGDDKPPTLIENPPAVRIINPVFEFLGTLPSYYEYEISFWFLIFFVLFTAMIFGDGGYGLIITLGALLSIFSSKRKGRTTGDGQRLFFVIGIVTLLWGALTGSWFGIAFDALPPVLQNISLPWINGQSPDSENNIKAVCFLIGFIQLSIAHLKNLKRDFPNLKFLSQVGSLLLLAGMFNLALNLVVDAQRFPVSGLSLLSIAAGFMLVFVFGSWTGKLGSSLVESLKSIISIFLGTVSVFADIVSYIRLWAVGLAGLAISQTVNGMAGSILGGGFTGFALAFVIKALLAVVLLAASHSLNFVMTILSVIVHGIRLNMLEFSGHLGMEWSGYKYDPLKEKDFPAASMQ